MSSQKDELLPDEAERINDIRDEDGNTVHVGHVYELKEEDFDTPELVKVASIEGNGVVVEALDTGIRFFIGDKNNSAFISKTASMISSREQQQLVEESGIARNLDKVVLDNSHYESEYPDFYSNIREVANFEAPLSNSLVFDDSSLFM